MVDRVKSAFTPTKDPLLSSTTIHIDPSNSKLELNLNNGKEESNEEEEEDDNDDEDSSSSDIVNINDRKKMKILENTEIIPKWAKEQAELLQQLFYDMEKKDREIADLKSQLIKQQDHFQEIAAGKHSTHASTTSNTSTTTTTSTTSKTSSGLPFESDATSKFQYHVGLSPYLQRQKSLGTINFDKPAISTTAINTGSLDVKFDIKKEAELILGVDTTNGKPVKDLSFKGLEIYKLDRSFDDWWKDFKFGLKMAGLKGKHTQICYSFIQYMDPSIQNYFKNISIDDNDDLTLEKMILIVV